MNPRLLIALAVLASPAWGQAPSAATAPAVDAPESRGTEPNVRLTVIEDRGARIEELRIRGQVTRIHVRPGGASGPGQGYEILPGREVRDEVDDRSGTSGAIGRRVWRVLSF